MNLDKFGLYQKVLNQTEKEKAKHEESQIRIRKEITRELVEKRIGRSGGSFSGKEGQLMIYAKCKNFLARKEVEKFNAIVDIPKIKFEDQLRKKRISIANAIKIEVMN